ncbi:MAG: M28 family peptidase [candidate division WOR-3 bacterium]|nr:MAG: M28 family peptidase [candidate division WOR-3 bacterium]
MKKVLFLMTAMLVVGATEGYLVRFDLNDEGLRPLVEQDLTVLAELGTSAIVLAEQNDLENISSLEYTLLDTDPQEGQYYIARPTQENTDLTPFGDILMVDGYDHLIKVTPGMLESLINHRVMVKRLSFTPMVLRSEANFPSARYNQTVADIVDLVDPDSIIAKVQRMQDFQTRLSTHDSCMAAANWIFSKFDSIGCDSIFFQNHTSGHAPNVIAVKHGTVYPDSIYAVICGHFDSYAFYSPNFAPGADDNASGTSAVLEAARVMSNYDFEYSIRYIAFSGEELGLYGSEYYSAIARIAGDSILGVINGDMLAYVDIQPETLEVIAKPSDPPCEPFADFFIAAADTYTTLLTNKYLSSTMTYSDHSPFWDQGYLALCNIEDWGNYGTNNPFVHTPGDSIGAGFNDLAFCTQATKAEIAALALLAVPTGTGIEELTKDNAGITDITIRPTIGNAMFTISMTAQTAGYLTIHDVTGRAVKHMNVQPSVDGYQTSVIWDGTDNAGRALPGGIYFVRSLGGISNQTAKLILMR